MEFGNSGFENDRDEQKIAVFKVKQQVVKKIWSDIPLSAKVAYRELEGHLLEGKDVSSFEFWEDQKHNIRSSARALNAKARQTFVEDAFAELLFKIGRGMKEPVVLFPKIPPEVQAEGQTMLDVYRFEKEILQTALSAPDHQAKQDIISQVVEKDPFANVPLMAINQFDRFLVLSDAFNDTSAIRTKTTMPGIDLRYLLQTDAETPKVELVINQV